MIHYYLKMNLMLQIQLIYPNLKYYVNTLKKYILDREANNLYIFKMPEEEWIK